MCGPRVMTTNVWKVCRVVHSPPRFRRKVELQHTFLKNGLCWAHDVERVFDVFLSRLNLIPNIRIAIGEGSVTGPSRSQIRSWLRKAASGNMVLMPLEHNRFMMLRNSGTSVEYIRVATVLVFLGLWKVLCNNCIPQNTVKCSNGMMFLPKRYTEPLSYPRAPLLVQKARGIQFQVHQWAGMLLSFSEYQLVRLDEMSSILYHAGWVE